MLFKNSLRLKGFYASFLLLFTFEIYIAIMLLSGEKLPCTCGGIISQMGWKTHLVFNAVFMIISILPTIYKPKSRIFSGSHE
ncbi:MauE/DoxX family redox-associated membrane protein [Pedobacter sp. NJ-S-72]